MQDILNRMQSGKRDYYYVHLAVATFIGFVFMLHRVQYGVDFTDDSWYTSDPYWVAKGITPYVNNWTQAPGFTIPLFVFHYIFLLVTGGNEGIIFFSRSLFCIWKSLMMALSFVLLKKAQIKVPAVLIVPLMILESFQLFAINYNTIGEVYTLLVFSLLVMLIHSWERISDRQQVCFSILCGAIAGRCVIGTPLTFVAFMIMLFFVLNRKKAIFKGFILGVFLAAVSVVLFCCIRGGTQNFIIGMQYLLKDLSYYDAMSKHGVPLLTSANYLLQYLTPFFVASALIFLLFIFLKNRDLLFNYLILLIAISSLACSLYSLSKYHGVMHSLVNATKYGWFIPFVCYFYRCEESIKRKLRCFVVLSFSTMCVYLLYGFFIAYGFRSRSYWNFGLLIFGIYCIYICIETICASQKNFLLCAQIGVFLIGCATAFFIIRGSYQYVFRDMPVSQLTARVESGVWKGCFTTPKRAATIVEIEQYLKRRTVDNDQVLCWGRWACFLNLLHNGYLCSASPLGTGQKNGFDFWHMYQVVPNKIYVHIDVDDKFGLLSDSYHVWRFITRFYKKVDELNYTSYDNKGKPVDYRIIEYKIDNANEALLYADRMATKVFDFK